MKEKLATIKQWLGTGSINVMGVQFSGKDTLAIPLARDLGACFVSSGDIMRSLINSSDIEFQQAAIVSQTGILTPTEQFKKIIAPYLANPNFIGKPLVLGSVGRWLGEEEIVMNTLEKDNHPLKAVIILTISTEEIWHRWEEVRATRNGGRADDLTRELVQKRLDEFNEKTLPVLEKYRDLGLAITIDASGEISHTYQSTIDGLYNLAINSR